MTEYGDGTLYRRGKTWWISYMALGKRRWESAKTTSRQAAKRLLQTRLVESRQGGAHLSHADRVTLKDLRELHRNSFKLQGQKSWKRAGQAWDQLETHLGKYKAQELDYAILSKYAAYRMEEVAPATVAYELAQLRRGFNLALRAKVLPTKPTFPTVRFTNVREGFFEPDELQRVLAELPPPLQGVIRFAAWTGWRIPSEVLTLTWDQVTGQEVRSAVQHSKTKEARTFPYAQVPELKKLIEERRALRQGPYVFHRNGKQIRSMSAAWAGATERAGVHKLMHDLRRTAVRNLERAGVSRDVARKITGHKTDSVYSRYNIVSSRDLSEAVSKLAKSVTKV